MIIIHVYMKICTLLVGSLGHLMHNIIVLAQNLNDVQPLLDMTE